MKAVMGVPMAAAVVALLTRFGLAQQGTHGGDIGDAHGGPVMEMPMAAAIRN